jgi:hypothetical protein
MFENAAKSLMILSMRYFVVPYGLVVSPVVHDSETHFHDSKFTGSYTVALEEKINF